MDQQKANRYSLKPYYEQTFTVIKQKILMALNGTMVNF